MACPNRETLSAVADSQIDLCWSPVGRHARGRQRAPWSCTARCPRGIPHAPGAAAWSRWPHIQVQLGEGVRSVVDSAADEHGLKRTIGASLPNFSQIPALLSQTNLLATMTPLVIDDAMERFGLCALEPPIPIKPTPFSFVWSFRLENDPASRWLRGLVHDAFSELQRSVNVRTSRNLSARRRAR
jgi:DNA-binding transcriptional LysR family regulator